MSTTSLITLAEFERLPDVEGERRELVEGEIITMPPPTPEHSDIALRIQRFLTERIGWDRVRPDHTGYLINESWLEPDVSVQWPDQRRTDRYFAGSPMIAVEVLSPREDTDSKVRAYFSGGALEVWLVNPRGRTLTVFEKRAGTGEVIWRLIEKEYRSEALGFTISLTDIFE
jgi:Uma2 family endonuclease